MQRLLVLFSLTFLSATHTSAASLSEQIIGSAERFLEQLVQDYLDNSQITGRTSIPPYALIRVCVSLLVTNLWRLAKRAKASPLAV